MGDVRDIDEARRARREAAKIGDFSVVDDTDDMVLPIEMTVAGDRRIAIIAPSAGPMGWAFTPDQADEIAEHLRKEAAEARAAMGRLPKPPHG
jgi:hypothetical protein